MPTIASATPLPILVFCLLLGGGVALAIVGIQKDRQLAQLQIDFVSKVSHELKTPLTSIRMFVETLKLGRVQEPAKVEQCLDVIAKETDRLSSLITRLLSWGAMEAGAFRVDLQPTQPAAVVKEALEAFDPQILRAHADLIVEIDEDLPKILADQNALVDALLNLLTNALRYGHRETPEVRVRVGRRQDQVVTFAVEDNGVGISLRDQRRIFDRFYRVDERYSRSTGGTGLGLSIAQHIVLAHRAKIEVKSKIGRGSTFTIAIPEIALVEGSSEQSAA